MEKFNYTGHKKLWNWLADNPGKDKDDYFIENEIRNSQYNDCYACQYTTQFSKFKFKDCDHCPINFESTHCSDDGTLYWVWQDLFYGEYYEEACEIARQIANLPVCEGVEYE